MLGTVHAQRGSLWTCQFSLRSIVFVTFVTAVCAATVGVSAALAAIFVPIVAIAAVRTLMRVAETRRHKRHWASGYCATFCQSIGLIVSITAISCGVAMAGTLAVTLVFLRHSLRLLSVVVGYLRMGCRLVLYGLRTCRRVIRQSRLENVIRPMPDQVMSATCRLATLGRSLLRRFCDSNAVSARQGCGDCCS